MSGDMGRIPRLQKVEITYYPQERLIRLRLRTGAQSSWQASTGEFQVVLDLEERSRFVNGLLEIDES